jgi:cell division protease FtsH
MSSQKRDRHLSYTTFMTDYVQKNHVKSVIIDDDQINVTLKAPGQVGEMMVNTGPLQVTPVMVDSLQRYGVNVEFRSSGGLMNTTVGVLPYIAILAVLFLLFRQSQGGQRGVFSFGKSPAKEVNETLPNITFKEVAGAEEAKQELEEIVEFLRDPDRFQRLGGRLPRGVLMVGPPGTGKTYLARAVAGEAGVPFFTMSGADFVEMFVGVGASRVRSTFEKAKAKSPCIIFIDELDAVGRHRGAGVGGGHDEREQTLNQLLVEMDGFETSRSTVILIAATNRPDVLDPALLRPGRFDRQVVIDMPDVRGREGILRIHTREVPLARDVNLPVLAKGTPGLSGADLQNLVNEAALRAARGDQRSVRMADFEQAKEKVMWGTERRSLVMSDRERKATAIHEAGHALVAIRTPGADPVHKISIVPRGQALGLTWFLPHEERHTITRSWCMGKLMCVLGGRAAEELVFDDITNGAANDIEVATSLARRMVCEWGMSDQLGPVMLGGKNAGVFLGKELVETEHLSEHYRHLIDDEIRSVVDDALIAARDILKNNRPALEGLADALLQKEVLDRGQVDQIVRRPNSAEFIESTEEPVVVEHKPADRDSGRGRRGRQQREEKRERPARQPEREPEQKPESEPRGRRPGHDQVDVELPDENAPPVIIERGAPPREREPSRSQVEVELPDDATPPVVIERGASPREQKREVPAPKPPLPVEAKPDYMSSATSVPEHETTESEPQRVPEPEIIEREPEPQRDPEPVSEPAREPEPERVVTFGRRTRIIRKTGLPLSSVPGDGVPVTAVVGDAEVVFGRSPRPADQKKPAVVESPVEPETSQNDGIVDDRSSKPDRTRLLMVLSKRVRVNTRAIDASRRRKAAIMRRASR